MFGKDLIAYEIAAPGGLSVMGSKIMLYPPDLICAAISLGMTMDTSLSESNSIADDVKNSSV